MVNFEKLKQVTNIEYVGPHQIQSTSMPSLNFTARVESQGTTNILCSKKNVTDAKKEK